MPAEQSDTLAEVVAKGGDLAALRALSKSELQQALKELGYAKLGERVRLTAVIAAAEVPAASAPEPPVDEEACDRTMVMHGAVQDIFDDGGLLKTTLRTGDASTSMPPRFSKVKVRYIASLLPDCRRFEAAVREFVLGEHEVPKALEKCIGTMRRGETCELICRAEYAYGAVGRPPDVPPGASIRYEVELISMVLPKKDRSEYTAAEKVALANELKAKGTREFGSGLWLEAQVSYHEASRLLLTEYEELVAEPGAEAASRQLLVACLLNIAQCALKRDEWSAAERACTETLERLTDPLGLEKESHIKALYRRAKARTGRSEFRDARADLKAVLALQPSSREARELWESLKDREQSASRSEEKVYGLMTSKLLYREYNVGRRRLSSYPRAFLELSIDGVRMPRIVFELFVDRAPKTCENFRCLCTGERGVSTRGTRLHYKGTKFHRAVPTDDLPPEYINESADGTGRDFEMWKGFLVQGGDISHGDGSGGESIWGDPFEDELPLDYVCHSGPGLLSMAGSLPMRDKASEEMMHVPHRNTSQFFITTKAKNAAQGGSAIRHFDGLHVCFGRVVEGMSTVNQIHKCLVDPAAFHAIDERHSVEIVDCGHLKSKEDAELERDQAEIQKLHRASDPRQEADEDEAVEVITRATWAVLGAGATDRAALARPQSPALPPKLELPKPTPKDGGAIISAEIDEQDADDRVTKG